MILSTDLRIKLKKLFEEKKFTEIDFIIEGLGDLEKLPNYILNLYAVSKAINKNSKISDYKISAYYFDKIFSEDKSNREAFYNLIVVSVKSIYFEYLEKHIFSEYEKNNDDPKILEGLAKMYFFYNDMAEASKYYEKLLKIQPNFANVWSSFLASLNYHYNFDQKKYLEFCKKFNDQFNFEIEPFKKVPEKNESIKIGFISADFKSHSVSLFLEDILKKLNKDEFKLIALSNLETSNQDNMTKNLKEIFDEWHDILNIVDVELIKFIRSLNLDILIDLSGHTYKNRINALKERCAVTQISWLGYCNSLGVKNIDYLIADPHLIKKNEENLYTEKVLYMPNIWNALSKPDYLPEIKNVNEKNNFFVYGSFNNFQKISLETIKIWSKIINQDNTELLLKNSSSFNTSKAKELLLEKFKKENVDTKKIEILDRTKTFQEHLEYFNKINLCLDTFPYPGVTTTFQSVLMGVPVLTMKGFNFNSRCGESINKNLGLDKLIANDYDDYLRIAINFRKNTQVDEVYKKKIRENALKSNLFDTETFANDFAKIIKSIS